MRSVGVGCRGEVERGRMSHVSVGGGKLCQLLTKESCRIHELCRICIAKYAASLLTNCIGRMLLCVAAAGYTPMQCMATSIFACDSNISYVHRWVSQVSCHEACVRHNVQMHMCMYRMHPCVCAEAVTALYSAYIYTYIYSACRIRALQALLGFCAFGSCRVTGNTHCPVRCHL